MYIYEIKYNCIYVKSNRICITYHFDNRIKKLYSFKMSAFVCDHTKADPKITGPNKTNNLDTKSSPSLTNGLISLTVTM